MPRENPASLAESRTYPNTRCDARRDTSAESSSGRSAPRGRARGRRSVSAMRVSAARIFSTMRIDHRVGDSREIERARQLGGLRGHVGTQRVARRGGEIEALRWSGRNRIRPRRLRNCTGSTMRSVASMPIVCRFLMNGMWCGWNEGSSSRNSAGSGSPFGVDALAVLERVAGLREQLHGLAQHAAILPRAVRHRRHVRLAEHLVRHLAAERLQQLKLLRRRLAFGHHVGVLEQRERALVSAVHDVLVGPLEVEGD